MYSEKSTIESAIVFSQTGNETTIKNLVSKLRFIAKVKPGEKLNVKDLPKNFKLCF